MKYNKTIVLIFSILICQMAGFLGSIFTTPAIPAWYNYLNKPSFSPPGWAIGTVWIVLFFLMGISLYLVLISNKDRKLKKEAIELFILQMILNILWSILFFGLQNPLLALVEIALLWFAILFTIIYFYRISSWASALLLPYISWVSFAAFLNFVFWKLNF